MVAPALFLLLRLGLGDFGLLPAPQIHGLRGLMVDLQHVRGAAGRGLRIERRASFVSRLVCLLNKMDDLMYQKEENPNLELTDMTAFPEYTGKTWLDTDVAHSPSYYTIKDENGNIEYVKNGRMIPQLRVRNLDAEIFNSILNPYITGNRFEQEKIRALFPRAHKAAFDRIAQAMSRFKDEDIGKTVTLKRACNPDAIVYW